MSTVLIIKAHPLDENASRTVKILDTFLDSYKENHSGDTLEVLDLYNSFVPEIDKDILTGWKSLQTGSDYASLSEEQQKKIARFNELTEQFLAADKVVVANALWNLNIPTRLKAWIDTINVAGKSFKYTENGPIGLIEGKKALHIQSNGGTYNGTDPSSSYLKGIFNFIGINDVSQLFIEGIDYAPEKSDEILDAAAKQAQELGKNF